MNIIDLNKYKKYKLLNNRDILVLITLRRPRGGANMHYFDKKLKKILDKHSKSML